MPNMFAFSRRRMKLGRLKVHLGDANQPPRSPARPQTKRPSAGDNENVVSASASGRSDDLDAAHCSPSALDVAHNPGSLDNWVAVSTDGDKPTPRFNHAAAVVGTKMIVVGGDSGRGLLDDTLILSLDKLTWATAAPKVYLSSTGLPLKIPGCKGHSLVSWGKMVLLVGGKTDPMSERVSVWSFDIETECWSHVEAKGEIPAARSGHSVIRAGPVLILFGGEDGKGKKLNDLHMFDLKSLTWLPLHYTGTRPSPRSNHVCTLFDDRVLLVFGGQSKSKILNDLYSLDFETMVWSRVKIRGYHPSPRAGCGGALCGTKWYISGGGSKKKRHEETLILDISKLEWSTFVTPPGASITIGKGFSLVPVHHKDKTFLVAFGGNRKEPSNQVEILAILKKEHSKSWCSAPDTDPLSFENCSESSKEFGANINNGPHLRSFDSVVRQSLASAMEHSISGRKSLSDSTMDPNSISGNVSLRKQFEHEEDYGFACKMQTSLVDEKYKDCDDCSISKKPSSQVNEQRTKQQETGVQVDIAGSVSVEEKPVIMDLESSGVHQKHGSITSYVDHNISIGTDGSSGVLTNPSNIYHLYEAKIATLITKNAMLEEQLEAALSNQEAAEKNLSYFAKAKQEAEAKLADTVKEVVMLKEKLASVELAQEEANNLSNIVHSDNVRLEHDVAFLKAVLDDTQKELHSTRGVLAGERARAFQLQVEVFHLKQKMQSMESRTPTPRKPFHM